MQQSTESQPGCDADVDARIFREEQLRQAAILRQMDAITAGIKNSFTIGVTALITMFLFAKVIPHFSANASQKVRTSYPSSIAAIDSNRVPALTLISHERNRRVTDPLHPKP
jgi:hypothetical protein